MSSADPHERASALQLHGVLAHWSDCAGQPWLEPLLGWEETERARRSLERRLRCAHIGRFKMLAARHELYLRARERNPLRWSGNTRNWTHIDTVTLNPERDCVVKAHLRQENIQQVAA